MEQRCNERGSKPARKPVDRRCVFRHELAGSLCELEDFTERPAIVLEKNSSRAAIRETDVQIDQNAVGRASALLIKDDRVRDQIEDFAGYHEIPRRLGHYFEPRPPNQLAPQRLA